MSDRRIDVVIITRDRAAELRRTLRRLAELPERPSVTVVDNGSGDETRAMVRGEHPEVQLVAAGRNLGAVGRTVGIRLSATTPPVAPYVAFCDDDTWWEPGSLSAAADLLDAHPAVAVVTARILVEPGGRDDPINRELRDSPLPRRAGLPGFPLASFLAGASVVRRSAYLAAGGFHPRLLIGGEEELLAADLSAAGWALVHDPAVVVHHQASTVRDAHLRRRQGIRNTLWFTWLRRPWPAAVRRTWRLLGRLPRDWVSAGGVAQALAGLPWVLRERRPLPAGVEADLMRLEPEQERSAARRYVS